MNQAPSLDDLKKTIDTLINLYKEDKNASLRERIFRYYSQSIIEVDFNLDYKSSPKQGLNN